MSPEHVMGLEKSMACPCSRPMDESVDAAIPGCQTPVRSRGRRVGVRKGHRNAWAEYPKSEASTWPSFSASSLPFRGCCGNTTSSAAIPHRSPPSKTELTVRFSGRSTSSSRARTVSFFPYSKDSTIVTPVEFGTDLRLSRQGLRGAHYCEGKVPFR